MSAHAVPHTPLPFRQHSFAPSDTYPVALLVKDSAFNVAEIEANYVARLESLGVQRSEVILFSLPYDARGKAGVAWIKSHVTPLLLALESVGVSHVLCADAAWFKVLAGEKKAEVHLGYAFPVHHKDFRHMTLLLGLNHKALIYNPENEPRLDIALRALVEHYAGRGALYEEPPLTHAHYPRTVVNIAAALESLTRHESLSCDIETRSLRLESAGLASIAFSWGVGKGVAFAIDYTLFKAINASPLTPGYHGVMRVNHPVRNLLRRFFERYTKQGGTLRFHNATFDVKVLIHELFMANPFDTAGLLDGLECLMHRVHDTKIIAYLALNSTAEIDLSLKSLAHEYAGNYAEENIKEVLRIPLPRLLEYNLLDASATTWVFERYYPRLVRDAQEAIYHTLMIPSLRVLVQMELTGVPISMDAVARARKTLIGIRNEHRAVFMTDAGIERTQELLTMRAHQADFERRRHAAKHPEKIQEKPYADFPTVPFNPQSTAHLSVLLYEVLGLPVIERTPTGRNASRAEVLGKLVHHTGDPDTHRLLEALIGFTRAEKILGTFITAFENAWEKGEGRGWLHGSFNLGGTVSGRMSSSKPNLQNLPANSTYAKLVKGCIQAPDGWLLVGADFHSLEDYVSALTTRDPQKLRVYEGHDLYEIEINGVSQTVRDDDEIIYQGRTYTAKEFHDTHRTL